MFGYVNKQTLLGNVGCDPEVHVFPEGKKVVNVSVATSVFWRDRQTGENQERVEWHRVVVRNNERIAEYVENRVGKGDKVYVEGMTVTRQWKTKDGQERETKEVEVSINGSFQVVVSKQEGDTQKAKPQKAAPTRNQRVDDLGDDIPFDTRGIS